jgi:hypothetical protein
MHFKLIPFNGVFFAGEESARAAIKGENFVFRTSSRDF